MEHVTVLHDIASTISDLDEPRVPHVRSIGVKHTLTVVSGQLLATLCRQALLFELCYV